MYKRRSSISIYRQISHDADNIKDDWANLLIKDKVPLYDLILVVKDDLGDDDSSLHPNDIFFQYFDKSLSRKGFYLIKYRLTTYKDIGYFLIADEMDNLFRLFVCTQTGYQRYYIGSIIDADNSLSLADINEIEPRDTYNEKIKIFRRDGSAMMIDKGATVLDFAFHIRKELGYHFDYALIDESETELPPSTRLSEGDTITIVADPAIEPDFQWFRYIKTSRAVYHMVKYFEPKVAANKIKGENQNDFLDYQEKKKEQDQN